MKNTVDEKAIYRMLGSLSLREKVALLSGKDYWSTQEIPGKGIESVVMTDGPHGVRIGNESSDREKNGTATAFPTGGAIASTWDKSLIYEVGVALGDEARAKQCDVLLGPCVNIVRTPLAGRNFETYSEDPFLAGAIGSAYVQGLQTRGVGASLKHFACNNQEFERTRGDSTLDERTLREIYLPAFEKIVEEANPWTIMCSYNRINGFHASQNHRLLTEILRDEWDYDGVVVSDWNANHEVYESVKAGLDLEMPGPHTYFGPFLEGAVKSWQLDEDYVDRAAARLIRLSERVRDYKAKNPEDTGSFSTPEHRELSKKVSEGSIVLLKNDRQALPIKENQVKKVAIVGPCAKVAGYGGGGSSIVNCAYTTTPWQGMKETYGDAVELHYEEGCTNKSKADSFGFSGLEVTSEGKVGFTERYYDNRTFSGEPVSVRQTDEVDFWQLFPQDDRIDPMDFSVRWSGMVRPKRTGTYTIKFSYQGLFRLLIDGDLIASDLEWHDEAPYPFYTIKKVEVELTAGRAYNFSLDMVNTLENERNAMIMKARYHMGDEEAEQEIAKAIELAKSCDRTIVFVGHPVGFEQEGVDRDDMKLPGYQNRLVEALSQVDDRLVVVLNTGAPVELPWVNQVSAILQSHFYGQEGGRGIASIISGGANPSGRLTTTYPLRLEDNPSHDYYPGGRLAVYGEGVYVGYRHYETRNVPVLFPFGHGLSYTTFDYSKVDVEAMDVENQVYELKLTVTNTGLSEGAEVVQLYVEPPKGAVDRPVKELKGFEKIHLKAGASGSVSMSLNKRSFAYYDMDEEEWTVTNGTYHIHLGSSLHDIRNTISLDIQVNENHQKFNKPDIE